MINLLYRCCNFFDQIDENISHKIAMKMNHKTALRICRLIDDPNTVLIDDLITASIGVLITVSSAVSIGVLIGSLIAVLVGAKIGFIIGSLIAALTLFTTGSLLIPLVKAARRKSLEIPLIDPVPATQAEQKRALDYEIYIRLGAKESDIGEFQDEDEDILNAEGLSAMKRNRFRRFGIELRPLLWRRILSTVARTARK